MKYEINVALNGRHLFATAHRSLTDPQTAALVMTLFREKFPEIDGYSVTCTRWENTGQQLTFEDLMQVAFDN